MSRSVYQMPFSPGGEFVWNRRLTHDGAETVIGQHVDRTRFTEVRLRQMYEGRLIVPAPFGDAPPPRYLENGRGKADQLAKEIAAEEGGDAPRTSLPAAPARRDTKKPAPAAAKTAAKTVGSKAASAGRRGRSAA